MPDKIKLYNICDEDGTGYPFETFFFPGGEPHVKIDPKWINGEKVWLDARVCTAGGFLQLLAIIDAIKSCKPSKLGLFIPYFPGARQDRSQVGTPHTLRLYVDLLKRCELDLVVVFDPHSDVLAGLMNVEIIEPQSVLKLSIKYDGIICPDAGAEKRVRKFAEANNITDIMFCHKFRNVETGKLTEFKIIPPMINNSGHLLIVDDICDGGATFIGLADEYLKLHRNLKLDLMVSHGIFSKGISELCSRFENIITSDSFPSSSNIHYCRNGNINEPIVKITSLFWEAAHIMKGKLS